MGRFYSGDISGKFWFAVQSSRAPERFGATEIDENVIHYICEDLTLVEDGIKECIDVLGENKEKFDKFFEKNASYNDEMLLEWFGLEDTEQNRLYIKQMLSDYADLGLGCKMRDEMKARLEECGDPTISFDAEC